MLDDLSAELSTEFTSAPTAMIENAVMYAARKLSRAKPIKHTSCFDSQCGVTSYAIEDVITLPEAFLLDRITNLSWCGECLPFTKKCNNSCQLSYIVSCDNIIISHDVADSEDGLCVCWEASLDRISCDIPECVGEGMEDELLNGARGKLMSIANQEWTDLRQALVYSQAFNAAVVDCKLRGGNIRVGETPSFL